MTSYLSSLPVIAIITPFIGAILANFTGRRKKLLNIQRLIAMASTFTSLLSLIYLIKPVIMDNKIVTYWMGNWKPESQWAIGIGLEVDAFSLFAGLIIAAACFLSAVYSYRYMEEDNGLDKYYVLFQLLSASMIGFVLTGDIFNMYVMLEIMTFASIALTSFRNNLYKSVEAGFKYIVIGFLGSSMVLLGTVLLYSQLHTLNLAQMAALLHGNYTPVAILALAFFLTGYAVKSFMVPCHTWQADAHMAAPSSISMLLSGAMSITGVYAMVRVLYMIYQSNGKPYMEFLIIFWGAVTILVGISMAVVQTDLKRLLAFISISQIGYIMAGFGAGLSVNKGAAVVGAMGGLFHMLNYSAFISLLFLCAGAILHQTGTTDLNKLGGLSKIMPYTTAMFIIGTLAISGIPLFNGFASKWLIYQATFEAGYALVTIIAMAASVLTLVSLIKVVQSVFFGQLKSEYKDVKEAPLLMRIPMIILSALSITMGIIPNLVSKYLIEPAVLALYNIGSYIDVMFEKGYAAKMFKEAVDIPGINYSISGCWNPISWLVLFIILLTALILLFSFGYRRADSKAEDDLSGSKYDTITGGEKDDYKDLSEDDIFWGLRYDLGRYIKFLKNAHSGIVNDYVLWIVAACTFITLYLFTLM